jgi:hypothetical protein
MATREKHQTVPSAAEKIRRAIEAGGERVWTVQDFGGLPVPAVAQTLSRLARRGTIKRVSKGLYYRPRATAFGPSRPNPTLLRRAAAKDRRFFPAGTTAANLLGFSTQVPAREELATVESSAPRSAIGKLSRIQTRRPEAWRRLDEVDGALLDLLRRRADASELSPSETVRKLLELLREDKRFERLVEVAEHEPPRVRAMLGALGEELGVGRAKLEPLRSRLNPLSRFDFGVLSGLKAARAWQAKERSTR